MNLTAPALVMRRLHGWRPPFRRPPVAAMPLTVVLCIALVVMRWWPGLAQRRTPIWGDTLPLGWPLMRLHAEALQGRASLLWNDGIYGGHPIFAEGQGGFAHPLNLLLALLATPALGAPFSAVLLHVIDLCCMALGMALLGRRLGLGVASCGVASLAVVFAPAILLQQNNIAIGGTLGFAPLSLWAFERCLGAPSRRSAALLAIMLSLVFLAGYPQTLHGLGIVMACRLAIPALGLIRRRSDRGGVGSARAPVLALAGAAILFCGLTAVQSLPLAQLVALSHRAGGVALAGTLGWRGVLRGCAMGNLTPSGTLPDDAFGIGSMLVWMPATLLPFLRPARSVPPALSGYALGAGLCMLAATGDTPVFPLLRGGLLPGMGFFRITVLYPAIAAIPVALLAGWVLDRIGTVPRPAIACVALTWLAILVPLRPVLAPLAIGTTAAAFCVLLWRTRAAPVVVLALLLLDVTTLRLHPFPFLPMSVLDMPERASTVRSTAALPFDRRSFGVSLAASYSLMLPQAPREPAGIERMLASLVPMTTLPRDIPSLDGALALPLQRRVLAEPLLEAGLHGAGAPPGGRLIDLLAVRFLLSDGPLGMPGVSVLRAGDGHGAWLYENRAVRPFAQGFATHETVGDARSAALRLADARGPILVIEDRSGQAPADARNGAVPEITLLDVEQTRLRMDVRSSGPGWVVVADADYPGWSATIDGRPAPVFPAQLLAKAVPVPAGRHVLVLRYRSLPFEIGLLISLLALGATGLLLLKR